MKITHNKMLLWNAVLSFRVMSPEHKRIITPYFDFGLIIRIFIRHNIIIIIRQFKKSLYYKLYYIWIWFHIMKNCIGTFLFYFFDHYSITYSFKPIDAEYIFFCPWKHPGLGSNSNYKSSHANVQRTAIQRVVCVAKTPVQHFLVAFAFLRLCRWITITYVLIWLIYSFKTLEATGAKLLTVFFFHSWVCMHSHMGCQKAHN